MKIVKQRNRMCAPTFPISLVQWGLLFVVLLMEPSCRSLTNVDMMTLECY